VAFGFGGRSNPPVKSTTSNGPGQVLDRSAARAHLDALRAAADRCQAAIAAAADSSDPHATRRLIEACANARDAIDDVLHLAAGTSRRGQVG